VDFRFPAATGGGQFAAAASAAAASRKTEKSGGCVERWPLVADASHGQQSDPIADGPAILPGYLFDPVVQFRFKMNRDDPAAAFFRLCFHLGQPP
jgi:hypothetical protein